MGPLGLLSLSLDPSLILFPMFGEDLDAWQVDVCRSRSPLSLWLLSRQAGKSTVAAGKALVEALTRPESLIICCSRSLRQSSELYRKIIKLYKLNGRPIEAERQTATELELSNGSRIVSLPGSEDTICGYSKPDMIVCDEAARIKDSTYGALLPMRTRNPSCQLLLITTPAGQRGLFWNLWRDDRIAAERLMLRATDNPRISNQFLDNERMMLGDLLYRQNHLLDFLALENSVFNPSLIDNFFTSDSHEFIPSIS